MKPNFTTTDPDNLRILSALKRAAKAARKLAEQTGTPFYVWQNERVVNLNPVRRKKSPPRPKLTP